MKMEHCNNPEIEYPLIDFQAGLLTGEELERIEAHIRECRACNSIIEHMQLLTNGLRRQSSQMQGDHPTTTEIVVYVDDCASLSANDLKLVQDHIIYCLSCTEEIERISQLNRFLVRESNADVERSSTTTAPPETTIKQIFGVLKRPTFAYLLAASFLALLVNERLSQRVMEDTSPKTVRTQETQVDQPMPTLSDDRTFTLQADNTKNGTTLSKSLHKPIITELVRTERESVVQALVITPEPDLKRYRYSIKLVNDAGREWTLSENFVDFGVTISNETVTNLALDYSAIEDGNYTLIFTAHDRTKPRVTFPVQYLFELITADKAK